MVSKDAYSTAGYGTDLAYQFPDHSGLITDGLYLIPASELVDYVGTEQIITNLAVHFNANSGSLLVNNGSMTLWLANVD